MKTFPGLVGAATLGFFAFRAFASRRMTGYSDRVVLITGASRGLGFILAREFLEEGAKVIVCARDSKELNGAQKDLQRFGPNLLTYTCDVSEEQEADKMIQFVFKKFGRLDVLVNNAGIIQVGPIGTMTNKDFSEVMAINFSGAMHTTLAALPKMERGGRIINITSIGGAIGVPHLLPYVASKFAMVGFSLGLRAELLQKGIAVVTVLPGLMRTGSFMNAFFKGNRAAEFTWFSLGASLPLISIDAERAARKIMRAGLSGTPFLTLGFPAKLARVFYTLAPGIGADLLSLINRALPKETAERGNLKSGRQIRPLRRQSPLTRLGTRAALKFREA